MDIAMDTTEGAAAATRQPSAGMAEEQARPAFIEDAQRRVKRETPSSKQHSAAQSPAVREETVGGDLTVKVEPGKAPKLSRTMSHKIVTGPRQLFNDLPDSTDEATSTFDVLPDCTYGARHLGTTEQALECDCAEEWGTIYHTCLMPSCN